MDGWIGWFRLSTHSESRSCWFNNSLTADQEIFDTCCQNVMRQLFTMFESACHNLTPSPERAFFDFLLSRDFVSLCETHCLRGNRECAIYLVMTLKTIFETWFADAVIELTNKPQDDKNDGSTEDNKVDVNSPAFMVMVQNVVGGAVSKLSSNKKFVSESAQELIKKMRLRSFEDTVTPDYTDKFVPQILQHNNRNGMSWMQEKFIPFSKDLMMVCRVAANGRNGYKKQHS